MIESLRVDDRLIHGQVALVWSKEFNTTRIVVVNDEAATNEVQQMTLKMATPDGIKLLIKSVDEAISLFNNPKATNSSIFVLTSNIGDALRIARNTTIVKDINVANVGRFDNSDSKTAVNDAIFLNKKEMEAAKNLMQLKIPVYHQVIPSNKKTPLKKLIENT